MSTILITIIETERRQHRTRIFGWILISVGMMEAFLFFATMTSPAGAINLVIALNCFVIGAVIMIMHGDKFFVTLTTENIEWSFMAKRLTIVTVSWDDVRWIKKEKDNSMTIYKDSSFSYNIDLSFFSETDAGLLLSAIGQTGAAKAIRLVNF